MPHKQINFQFRPPVASSPVCQTLGLLLRITLSTQQLSWLTSRLSPPVMSSQLLKDRLSTTTCANTKSNPDKHSFSVVAPSISDEIPDHS